MSWFSDLAKTAFNEAQKRIDKVLDIDEETNAKSDGTFLPKNTYIEDPAINETLLKSRTQYQSPVLTSNKINKGNSSSKKRGKPLKLGSSLSKKQTSKLSTKRSTEDQKDLKTPKIQSNQFEEISLNDSSSLSNNSDYGALNNSPQNLTSEQSESDSPNLDSSNNVPKRNGRNTSSPIPDSQLNGRHLESNPQTPKEDTILKEMLHESQKHLSQGDENIDEASLPVSQHHNQISSDHAISEAEHPSCVSKTTSGEIENLNSEDAISDPITETLCNIQKEEHLLTAGGDLVFDSELSPVPEDAVVSETVKISERCCSPLSTSVCDETNDFQPPLSSDRFIDSTEISPIKTTVDNSTENISSTDTSEVPELTQTQSADNSTISTSEDDTDSSGTAPVEETFFSERKSVDFVQTPVSVFEEHEAKPPNTTEANIIEAVSNEENEVTGNKAQLETENLTPEPDISSMDDGHSSETSSQHEDEDLVSSAKEPSSAEKEEDSHPSVQDPVNHDVHSVMCQKLAVYDQQIVTLSLNNASLSEENDNLRSEISNLKQTEEKELNEERQNLIETVEDLSNKLEDLESEKDEIQSELVSAQAELATRLSNEQVQSLLAEKEESIQGLLLEGETLSKTHLQQSNTIKKLRTKLAEQNANNKEFKDKLASFEEENKSLKFKLTEIQGQSSEDRGTAERLSEAFQEREMQLNEMRSKLEDAEEKRRAAQSTLDAAYKDLAEMNKKQATLKTDREAEFKEHEIFITKKLQQEIEKLQQDHDHQIHMRLLQLGELQDNLERAEATYTRKEDQLRKEVKDLQQRLHDSELRNHDLSQSISESTRPILRQMENLQSTYSAQTKTWEALEKSLTTRLGDAQIQLVSSQDKERSLQMTVVDLKSRVVTLEQQLKDARQEKTSFETDLAKFHANASLHDDEIAKLRKELEVCETSCKEVKAKARRDRVTLENQLDMEKVRSEADRKKYQAQLETVQKEKERLLWMNRSDSMTSSASMLNADTESVVSSSDTFNTFEVFERQSSSFSLPNGVYDSVRSGTSGPSLLENLQSQLKMRDGEIAQLQGEINTLERTRSSMAEEIVRLTNDNEDLHNSAKHVEALRASLKDVESRHEAVLTMYGEKAEEAEELKMDLEDVKMMYRNQIDSLLKSHC